MQGNLKSVSLLSLAKFAKEKPDTTASQPLKEESMHMRTKIKDRLVIRRHRLAIREKARAARREKFREKRRK